MKLIKKMVNNRLKFTFGSYKFHDCSILILEKLYCTFGLMFSKLSNFGLLLDH